MKPSIHPNPVWPYWRFSAKLSLLLLSLCTLTACENWFPFGNKPSTIQEPPFIPAASQAETKAPEEAVPVLAVSMYSDLPELSNTQRHSPLLAPAVSHAISLGILKPSSPEEAFQPNTPIQYGEFQQWANTYQNVASQTQTSLTKPEQTAKIKPNSPATGHPAESMQSPFNAEKIHLLTGTVPWQANKISPSEPLSRELLCALYVLLAQKMDQVQSLQPQTIEQASPGGSKEDNGEASQYPLVEFKDFFAISNWAKPYVALAYKDGLVQKITGLTGEQLTVDFGFQPKTPATREQAILVLNTLYGNLQAPEKPETTVSPSTGIAIETSKSTAPLHSAEDEKHTSTAAKIPVIQRPPILQHQATVTETGPGLYKKATHISVPH